MALTVKVKTHNAGRSIGKQNNKRNRFERKLLHLLRSNKCVYCGNPSFKPNICDECKKKIGFDVR